MKAILNTTYQVNGFVADLTNHDGTIYIDPSLPFKDLRITAKEAYRFDKMMF